MIKIDFLFELHAFTIWTPDRIFETPYLQLNIIRPQLIEILNLPIKSAVD